MTHFHPASNPPPSAIFLALLKEEELVVYVEDTGLDENVCVG